MLTAEYLAGEVIEIRYLTDGMKNSVDLLSPLNCLELRRSLLNALLEYERVTGKLIPKIRKKRCLDTMSQEVR